MADLFMKNVAEGRLVLEDDRLALGDVLGDDRSLIIEGDTERFRGFSMCTYPDQLVGPLATENENGKIR